MSVKVETQMIKYLSVGRKGYLPYGILGLFKCLFKIHIDNSKGESLRIGFILEKLSKSERYITPVNLNSKFYKSPFKYGIPQKGNLYFIPKVANKTEKGLLKHKHMSWAMLFSSHCFRKAICPT